MKVLLTVSQTRREMGTEVVWEDLASDDVRRKVEVEKHWTRFEDAANPGSWARILQSQCQVSLVY
jgi:hypothetical protein